MQVLTDDTMDTATDLRNTLKITFTINGKEYGVVPLHPDPEVASKAFRLIKRHGSDRGNYDVMVDEFGPQCECWGWLRHRHCKHINALKAAGMI